MSQYSVLVVGGGPSGLITALALLKNGIHVRIIEKRDSPHGGIRGTGITPRTLEIFASLGVLDDVLASSTFIGKMAVHSAGKVIDKEIAFSESAEDSPTIPYRRPINLSQPALETALRSNLTKNGVNVEYGVELIGIEQKEQGGYVLAKVKVEGKEVEEKFSYIISADGGRGTTRKILGVKFLGETPGETLFTANVECEDLDRELWHMWGDIKGSEKGCFMKPVEPAPLYQFIAAGDLDRPLPTDTEGIQAMFNSITKSTDITLRNASWISEWRANIRMVDRFSVGRVFLVGECAHCHSPTGGQGINTAAMDALNVAWKVALVHKGLASSSLLSSYESERLPVVAQMLKYTTKLHNETFHDGSLEEAMHRPKEGHQLGVNYRWSSIVLDGRTPEVAGSTEPVEKDPYGLLGDKIRAGDRAPDATQINIVGKGGVLGAATRLFALTGDCTKHHVLLFGGHSAATVQDAQSALNPYSQAGVASLVVILRSGADIPTQLVDGVEYARDDGGHAYRAYDVGEFDPLFVVVRPDGMIGAFAVSVEQVEKYFSKFLSVLA